MMDVAQRESALNIPSVRRVCVTPTRNESWIIKPFLAAAKCWATDILIADQGSTDGTQEKVQQCPTAELLINTSPVFDENHRQQLLLTRARQIPGKRILIGLDADEALTANSLGSKEWETLARAKEGTVLRFRWINILPGFKQAWIRPGHVTLGFVDDGSTHAGNRIHSPRVPAPRGAPELDLEEIAVLHFQYVIWERMESKQRWYQAWEHNKHQQKGPLDLFRQYNHMYGGWRRHEIVPFREEWLEGYEQRGIDFRSLACEPVTWWDREIAQMLIDHGPEHFRRIAIWDKNWTQVARAAGLSPADLRDPRSIFERLAHKLLRATQSRRDNVAVRAFERILRMAGW